MKLQTSATQVALRTATLLRAAQRNAPAPILEPTWYRVLLANPPTHQLLPRLRKMEEQLSQDAQQAREKTSRGFYVTRNKKRFSSKGKHLYKVPKLQYAADSIRQLFYTNHPWEMARPRNVIEKSGDKAISLRDWSYIVQPGMRLSGESVVQRALWLAAQPKYKAEHQSDWYHAYDQARLEFYRVRMREFAEQQVATEEALMHGAVFGASAWDVGLAQEQKYIENFVVDAVEATKNLNAHRANAVSSDETPEEEPEGSASQ